MHRHVSSMGFTMRYQLILGALTASAVTLAGPPAAKPQIEFDYACNAAAKKLVAQGLEAEDNLKAEEARPLFQQALAADPRCLVARVSAARNTSGPELKKAMDEVVPLAAAAPEVEKQLITAMDAGRSGHPEKQLEILEKLSAAYPQVYRAQMLVAGTAADLQLYEKSIEAAKKAAALNPKGGAAWNMLGWTYTLQHKLPEAITAYEKYVALAPKEPNAHDSLADAYLAAGKIPEALAEFQKAVDLLPRTPFLPALDGVATAKLLQGDFEGARTALTRYHDNAKLPWQKPYVSRFIAATWAIEGKSDKALAALEQAVTEGKPEAPAQSIYGVLARGWYLNELGRWNDALATLADVDKVPTDAFSPGQVTDVAAGRASCALRAHAGLGKLPDAEKDLAALKKLLEGHDDPYSKDSLAYGEGLLAVAKKDTAGATAAFKRCTEQSWDCRAAWIAVDPAGTGAVRDQFLAAGRRDPVYLVLRAKLLKPAAAPGARK